MAHEDSDQKPPEIDTLIDLILHLTPADKERLCRLIAAQAGSHNGATVLAMDKLARLAADNPEDACLLREAFDAFLGEL